MAQTAVPVEDRFAAQVFEPAPAGDRFFAVADARSHTDSRLRLMLLGNWAYAPVLTARNPITDETTDVISSQLYLNADVAYPFTDWLHAHIDVPFAAVQNSELADPEAPEGGRFGDLRLGLRANVLDPYARELAFGPAVDVWVPTGSEEDWTGDGSVRVNPRVGISGKMGVFVYAANLGYLFREDINTASVEVGDAVTFGVAAGLSLFENVLQVGPELWGSHHIFRDDDDTEITPVSALFGARVHLGDFVLGLAAGPGVTEAPGVAPRVIFSAALAPEPDEGDDDDEPVARDAVDRDGDGIADSDDACPDEPGVVQDDPTRDGCPAPSASDRDGDGIPDAQDACPNDVGRRWANAALNGCPGLAGDADGDGVMDKDDACPTEAGQPTDDAATNGCPEGRSAPTARSDLEPAVNYAGFHVFDDGSSRVFVKLTREVPIEVKRKEGQVDYVLKGARVTLPNNKNPLVTEHFITPVVTARLLSEGDSAVLRVNLRQAVQPKHRVARHTDGMATLHVDFPAPRPKGRSR